MLCPLCLVSSVMSDRSCDDASIDHFLWLLEFHLEHRSIVQFFIRLTSCLKMGWNLEPRAMKEIQWISTFLHVIYFWIYNVKVLQLDLISLLLKWPSRNKYNQGIISFLGITVGHIWLWKYLWKKVIYVKNFIYWTIYLE